MTEGFEPDFKSAWQDQPTEKTTMSSSELRARAEGFQRRRRRMLLINDLAAGVIAAGFCLGLIGAPNMVAKLGSVLGVLGALSFAWWNHQHRTREPAMVEDAGQAILDFHRRALMRARSSGWLELLIALQLLLGLDLIWLTLAASIHPGLGASANIVSFSLAALAFWAYRRRLRARSRDLQRQIDELDAVRLE